MRPSAPGGEGGVGLGTGVHLDRRLGSVVRPRRIGTIGQDLGVEVPPGDLAGERLVARTSAVEPVQDLTGMEASEVERGREPRGGVSGCVVAELRVGIDGTVEEGPEGREGAGPTGRNRQVGVAIVGGRKGIGSHAVGHDDGIGVGVGRHLDRHLLPPAVVRREDAVRPTGSGGDGAGVDRVGRPDLPKGHAVALQRLRHQPVAANRHRRPVPPAHDRRGAARAGQAGDDIDGIAHLQHQPPVELVVELDEARAQEGPSGGAGAGPESGIHHEDRAGGPAVLGVGHGRLGGQPEVPAKPHDRRAHARPRSLSSTSSVIVRQFLDVAATPSRRSR